MPDGSNILVVDDDDNLRGFLSRVLRQAGYNVFEAENNSSALRIVENESIDLITTDMVHPVATGIDLVVEVRKMTKGRHTPILMITGQSDRQIELAAWRAGVSSFMNKPFAMEQLLATIETQLGQSSEMDLRLISLGIEGRDLDYKESIDLDSKPGRAEFARDVIGMANAAGGTLVVGIAEKNNVFVQKGVPASDLSRYETTKLNDAIQKYVLSTAYVSSKVTKHIGKSFVLIRVHGAKDSLAFAAIADERVGLYPGRIYTRTQAGRTTEVTDALELRRLIDRIVDDRLKRMLGNRDN